MSQPLSLTDEQTGVRDTQLIAVSAACQVRSGHAASPPEQSSLHTLPLGLPSARSPQVWKAVEDVSF